MKNLAICLLCALVLTATARAQSGGVVFTHDKAVPVVGTQIWIDPAINWIGAYPSADILVGFDNGALVGYSLTLNWHVTPTTSVFAGAAYLSVIEEVRLRDLIDRLGLTVGVRLRM